MSNSQIWRTAAGWLLAYIACLAGNALLWVEIAGLFNLQPRWALIPLEVASGAGIWWYGCIKYPLSYWIGEKTRR